MRRRISLARALLNDADALFLDEPTAGLDPVAARDVHDPIDGLRQSGVTIFLITHRLDEAERLCDRAGLFNSTLHGVRVYTPLWVTEGWARDQPGPRRLGSTLGTGSQDYRKSHSLWQRVVASESFSARLDDGSLKIPAGASRVVVAISPTAPLTNVAGSFTVSGTS